MLVCFGFSWPINLIKNIKAKTAKSMSLQFILLIIFGYIAGITAKLTAHKINYVLIVYLLNLLIVSINLIVYFINKRNDRKNNTTAKAIAAEEGTMKKDKTQQRTRTEIENKYIEMNKLSESGGIVFFGSDYFSSLPFSELARSFNMENSVYNRSVAKKKIDEICGMIDVCVLDLKPSKIFVNLGDSDIKNGTDIEKFILDYEWMLYTINNQTKADIYVVSVMSDSPLAKEINKRLKKLSEEYGCRYVDITGVLGTDSQDLHMFDLLKSFARTHPITFDEAMNSITV